MQELKLLKLVSDRLSLANIEYMLSGSLALNFYAQPRMTRDIDIIININEEDVNKIYKLFKKDFYIDKRMILDAIKNNSMFNIIHLDTVIKIDFIIRKNNEYRILEFNKREKKKINDIEIYVVSVEDLIISKLYWAKNSFSELQIRDVKILMKKDFDKEYVEKWCKNLKIDDILKKALEDE